MPIQCRDIQLRRVISLVGCAHSSGYATALAMADLCCDGDYFREASSCIELMQHSAENTDDKYWDRDSEPNHDYLLAAHGELLGIDLAQHVQALIKANAMEDRVGFMRTSVAVDLMLQCAEALWELHSKGIIHRDLKPSNILVRLHEVPELSARGYFSVKLADFGLAKREVVASQTAMVGTKIYGAPEVFTENVVLEKKFPRRADVWSFGITNCLALCPQDRPPASMQGFAGRVLELMDFNHTDACKPSNKEHPAYRKLLEFIGDVSNVKKDTSGDRTPSALDSQMSLKEAFHYLRFYQKVVAVLGNVLNVRKVLSGPGHFYGISAGFLKNSFCLLRRF